MDWQPIETAPKDGTPMLLCYCDSPEQDILPIASGFWSRLSERWFCELSGQDLRPTHWMPLPASPALTVAQVPRALEPVSYRWRAPGSKYWIYDPTLDWIEIHKHEVELEPLFGASAVTVGGSVDTPSPSTSHADRSPIEKTEGGA